MAGRDTRDDGRSHAMLIVFLLINAEAHQERSTVPNSLGNKIPAHTAEF